MFFQVPSRKVQMFMIREVKVEDSLLCPFDPSLGLLASAVMIVEGF
jgi:hypothetical protein